jgi:predicted ATP-binding protein involved in virulence
MKSNVSNKIKKHIKNSEAGDFRASYQVAMTYLNGVGVNKDLPIAEKYKRIYIEQLRHYKFRISSIKLINFKGFEELSVDFSKNSNTTVLVGNNGSGKSTVLDAIKKTLTHLSSRLSTRSFNGDIIETLEINNSAQADYALIIPTFELNNHTFNLELAQSKPLKPNKDSDYEEANEFSRIFKHANSIDDNFNFPLLASYNVERAQDVTTKDIEKSEEIKESQIWDKSKAYSKSLNGKADFKLFFRWFKESVGIDNLDSNELNELKAIIKAKEAEFNTPLMQSLIAEDKKSTSPDSLVRKHVKKYNEEMEVLLRKLNNLSNLSNKTLDTVRNAIYNFLPGFSELKLRLKPLDLLMRKDGLELSVLQLSQGEKTILALVADIARRLTLLNPAEDNPLNGTGIILIDEIDLHLHPKWQQLVIPRLENTFPNIQFIVTTHSPQVLTTVRNTDIRILSKGSIKLTRALSFGEESRSTLEDIMGTDSRPKDKKSNLLQQYMELVNKGDIDSVVTKNLRVQLNRYYGEQNSQLRLADMMINRVIAIQSKNKP